MLQLRYPDVISGPPRPSAIIRRDGSLLGAGVERYVVPGGGAVLVDVEAGDRIGISNAEGGQACELVALDRNGRSDPGILDVAGNSNAAGLKALLLSGDGNLRQFRAKLERRGIDLGGAQAVRIFGAATPAGTEESFTAQRAGSLVVAAPGGPMSVDGAGHAHAADADDPPRNNQAVGKVRAARSARRSGARPAHQVGHRAVLLRQGRRLHPDHRCRRPPVHRLPVLLGAQARQGSRPSARRDDDAHADGIELSDARPAFQILRPGHGAAGRGGAGHLRPARRLRAGLRGEILRRHRLSRPCQLLDQFQRRAGRQGREAPRRLDGGELLLQHLDRRAWAGRVRRAVVAPRRLCADARADRPDLRFLGLPRRHDAGQWLGPDRHPCPHL